MANKKYGVNLNLNLDSKKINDLDKLVKLYEQLKTTKLSLNRVQDKTTPISIKNQIKTVSNWVDVLAKSIANLQAQFGQVTGLGSKEAKIKLSNMALDFAETDAGENFGLKTRQDVEKLVANPSVITPKTTNEAKKTANATDKIAKDTKQAKEQTYY